MPKAPSQEWLKGWEERIEAALEGHKSMSPEMALDMQQVVQKIEAEAEAKGFSIPKHSHRFAPENLWPDEHKEN